jgi:LysR family transcriptional regulator, hypochlorite-specific transcription factor HypT
MDTKWLEDFISLAETRSFSRSALLRNVTQPAFSRRIQSLEAWAAVDLIDRTVYPTRLTKAGEVFYEQALEMLAQISQSRALLRGQRPTAAGTIDFAVPHTLSLTFIPKWLSEITEGFGPFKSRLIAANVHDAVLALVEGACDLLVCYHHPSQPVQLDSARYEMLKLGTETVSAYAQTNDKGLARFVLPGTPDAQIPFLSYTNSAYLGRMVEVIMAQSARALHLDKRYETDMAEGLKMMTLEGHGVAFLPASSVHRELKSKQLSPAGGAEWSVDMEIRLYREKPSERRRGERTQIKEVGARNTRFAADELWEFLSVRSAKSA